MEPNSGQVDMMNQIHDDMRVLDVHGDEVGKVNFVQFSDPEAVTTPEDRGVRDPNTGLLDVLDVNKDDDATERMRQTGYIRIDAKGWFAGDKYAGADQLASVSGDVVHLSVSKDAL